MNDDDLKRLEDKVDKLTALVTRALGISTDAPVIEYAYERPEMLASEVIADGHTVNADGSVWGTSKGESGPEGTRYRLFLGYISEKKFPEIWEAARALLDASTFANWEAGWKVRPFGLYRMDPRPMIANGTINFATFNMAVGAPFMEHVQ